MELALVSQGTPMLAAPLKAYFLEFLDIPQAHIVPNKFGTSNFLFVILFCMNTNEKMVDGNKVLFFQPSFFIPCCFSLYGYSIYMLAK